MAGPGCRLLLACFTLALTANCTAVTDNACSIRLTCGGRAGAMSGWPGDSVDARWGCDVGQTAREAADGGKFESKATRGFCGLQPTRRVVHQHFGGTCGAPGVAKRRVELTAEDAPSELLLAVTLVSVVLLLVLILTSAALVITLNRRATRGTYSPSRQEKDGSRVEMWSITQTPPVERLI